MPQPLSSHPNLQRRVFLIGACASLAGLSFGVRSLLADRENFQGAAKEVFAKAKEAQKQSNRVRPAAPDRSDVLENPNVRGPRAGLNVRVEQPVESPRLEREPNSGAQPLGYVMSEAETVELARRIREMRPKQDLSQEIIDAIHEKLGFELDKDRIAKGLAIAEEAIKPALQSANPNMTQDAINEATQVAFVAYEMTFAMVKAGELYGVRNMEDFRGLSSSQLQSVVLQMNNASGIERGNFGMTMQPFVTDLALYVGNNPGTSNFFMDNFLSQFR